MMAGKRGRPPAALACPPRPPWKHPSVFFRAVKLFRLFEGLMDIICNIEDTFKDRQR